MGGWRISPPPAKALKTVVEFAIIIWRLKFISYGMRAKMSAVREILLNTIEEKRPLVLLLGQDAWRDSERGDAVLASALKKLGRGDDAERGWSATLGGEPLPADYHSWLAERFERRVHPQFIEILSEMPLSAAFTSSVDPTLSKLFSQRGRQAEPILTAQEHPSVARSRARPPLYYLFSRAGEGDPNAQPPSNRSDIRRRRAQHALPLLNRILDTATPVGLIVVEGFNRDGDWLRFGDLLDSLASAGSGQVLWFGGRPELNAEDDDYFSEMEGGGRILVEPTRLGSAIADLRATGQLADAPLESEDAGTVSLENGSFEVSPAERLRVEAAASIVDDSWTAFLPPLGADSEYDAFRRFHGIAGGQRLLVEGVQRGFAIERDFERELTSRVYAAIADHSKLNSPIILEGQSGTGKSVALARIVAKVREGKAAAALYAIGRIPQTAEISDFCQRAERSESPVTLIVCDANRDVASYDELLSGLRSRGRRVVVLGSQYKANEGGRRFKVEAPSTLSKTETRELSKLIKRYAESPHPVQFSDSHFLAALYRNLPASRPRIGSGLGDEARSAAQTLHKIGSETQLVYDAEQSITQLHEQLIEKGYISEYQTLWDSQPDDPDGGSAGKIIDMVMVAGSLNCPVPVNLLLRAVSGQSQSLDSALISRLFRDLDLFRWTSSDSEGRDWLLRPRLTLEADLICQRRLGGAQAEANVLVDLIGSALHGSDDASEREFLLNLLRKIGRDGFKGNRYKRSYVDFARKLTELREHFNVVDARFMLQESAFRRWAIREDERIDNDERFDLLGESLTAVQTALNVVGNGQTNSAKRARQNLLVEHAAIYGFLARYHVDLDRTSSDIWPAYETARVAVRKAVSATNDYYPHDVGLWIPADLFNRADLKDEQQAELAADMYSALDEVEIDAMGETERERFEMRRMMVGEALRDHDLSDDAYAQLEKSGSTAGYFLRARNYAPDLEKGDAEISAPSDLAKAKKAADFLEVRFSKIQNDERCLWLMFENRWIAEMKRHPLRGEREPLPAKEDARRQFLEIARTLNAAGGESARYGTRYLEAVLMWLTEDYVAASEAFRQIYHETDSVYRARISQRHVITDSNGHPVRFTGRIERQRGEGRWDIRVDQLGQTVALLESSFPNEDIQYGRTLSDFAISFNFIGPIADRIRR